MDTATDVEDFDFGTLGALRPGADEVPPPLPAGAIAPVEDGVEAEVMAVPPPLPAPTGQRRDVRSALLWSGAGFLAGAFFWHAVGVWGFVSSTVLDGGPESEFARAEAAGLPSAASLLAEAPRPGSEAAAGDAAAEMPFETTTTAEATEATPASEGNPVPVAAAAPEVAVSQEPAKATETAALPELPQVTEPEPEVQKVATPEPQKVAAAEPQKVAAAEPQVKAPAEASAPAEGAEKTKPETVYMVDPSNCTALVLDRSAKRTTTGPCPDAGLALRLESKGGREDLALASTLQPAGFSRD